MAVLAHAPRPSYDSYLRAFHTAFEMELSATVWSYPMTGRDRVLDIPCGDGFYTALFARHMPGGLLVAADQSCASLCDAERHVGLLAHGPKVEFHQADVYALPFDAESFDLVWCAQSMISLSEPVKALREIRRVIRPGGRVAVLETDEYHHVVLPWPVELELAIQKAVQDACRRKYGDATKFSQARKLRAALQEAGFAAVRKTTLAADRQAPFGPAEREFLSLHFEYLRTRIVPEMGKDQIRAFERFVEQDRSDGMFNMPSAELTVIASLHHASA